MSALVCLCAPPGKGPEREWEFMCHTAARMPEAGQQLQLVLGADRGVRDLALMDLGPESGHDASRYVQDAWPHPVVVGFLSREHGDRVR